jgi:hypothetical protein
VEWFLGGVFIINMHGKTTIKKKKGRELFETKINLHTVMEFWLRNPYFTTLNSRDP